MRNLFLRLLTILLSWLVASQWSHAGEWEQQQMRALGEWSRYREHTSERWKKLGEEIVDQWGKLAELPGAKTYVEYSLKRDERLKIDFEAGVVRIESLDREHESGAVSLETRLKQAVQSGVLQEGELPIQPVWATETDRVLGSDGRLRTRKSEILSLVQGHREIRARRYLARVNYWAGVNQVEPALVMAIMERESAFNPRARSWVPAFGLMQIVPKFSGREVLGKTPSEETLYDPETNIRVGTTYLRLLQEVHFSSVSKGPALRYLVICAYNWGPGRIRKAIDSRRILPLEDPDRLFDRLQAIAPDETRKYLREVVVSWRRYRGAQSSDATI